MDARSDAQKSRLDSAPASGVLTLRMNRKDGAMVEVTEITDLFGEKPPRKICLSLSAIHSFEKARPWRIGQLEVGAEVGTFVRLRNNQSHRLELGESYDTLKNLIVRAMRDGFAAAEDAA